MLSDWGQIGLHRTEIQVLVSLRNTRCLDHIETRLTFKTKQNKKTSASTQKLLLTGCLERDLVSSWPSLGLEMAASRSDLHLVCAFPAQGSGGLPV